MTTFTGKGICSSCSGLLYVVPCPEPNVVPTIRSHGFICVYVVPYGRWRWLRDWKLSQLSVNLIGMDKDARFNLTHTACSGRRRRRTMMMRNDPVESWGSNPDESIKKMHSLERIRGFARTTRRVHQLLKEKTYKMWNRSTTTTSR